MREVLDVDINLYITISSSVYNTGCLEQYQPKQSAHNGRSQVCVQICIFAGLCSAWDITV